MTIIAWIVSFLFPFFLINAIRDNGDTWKKDVFTLLACLSFGYMYMMLLQ